MRTTSPALVLALVACSAVPSTADSGGPDASAGPSPPSPPLLTPCPPGWREVRSASGVVTCDPWPESGYRGADCAWDEAHFPGTPGCARVGTECPADGWPASLPTDRTIVWVRADAAPGGDGSSRARALRTIGAASAVAPAGAIIAVGIGRYDEPVRVLARTTLWGACVSGTRIVTSAASSSVAALTLAADGAGARNLGIDSPARVGIAVINRSTVTIDAVVVARATFVGVYLSGRSTTASDLVVRSTRGVGYGIEVNAGVHVVLSRALIEDNRDDGVLVGGAGASFDASDVAVRGTRERADHAGGRGVEVQPGAHATLSRAVIEDNREAGILAAGAVVASDLVVRGTRERASDRRGGRGVEVQPGAHVTLSRALVEDNRDDGILVGGVDANVDASDVVVRGTRERAADGMAGRGIEVHTGAHLVATRALVEDNRDVGVTAVGAGTSIEANDVVVRDTMARSSDASWGVGIWAQSGARIVLAGGRVERCRMVGIASVEGASVEARDVVVSGVEASRCVPGGCTGDSGGFGLAANRGGTLVAMRFTVEGATLCGVLVGGNGPTPTGLALESGVVDRSAVGVCIQVEGYDISRLMHDVEYRAVGVPLQATSYQLPNMP